MAVVAKGNEPPWLEDELWLAEQEEPDDVEPEGVADLALVNVTHDAQHRHWSELGRLGMMLLAVCLCVAQLAWPGLLVYFAFRVLF